MTESAVHLSADERKRRGIRRDGQPRAASMKGYARVAKAKRREQAEERTVKANQRLCGHNHTTAGADFCRANVRARMAA